MAAPHVSGAAALLAAEFPLLSPVELKNVLMGSVDPLPALAGLTVTGGRLNVNNALNSNFVIAGAPASQTIEMGESATVTVSVHSLNSFNSPVTLSLVSPEPTITGSFSVNPVTPPVNGSAESVLTITTTTATLTGTYVLTIVGTDDLGETNSERITLKVGSPDFTVSVSPASQLIGPGDGTTYTVTVSSIYIYSGPVALSITSSDPEISGVFNPDTVIAPADGSVTSTLTVSATQAAQFGDYTLTIEATDGIKTRTATSALVVNDVDLVMKEVLVSATSIPIGGYYTVTNTVTNQGTQNASGGFQLSLYLSTDTIPSPFEDRLICEPYLSGLAAGASSTFNCNLYMYNSTSPGTYYIVAKADNYNHIQEINETNNVMASTPFEVVRDVDLVMTEVSTSATSIQIGNPFTITNTVTNQGTTATSYSSFRIGLYLSTDEVITASDTEIGYRYTSGYLDVGRSSSADTIVTIHAGLPTGIYYIGAIADDYPERQPENNETNNAMVGNMVEIVPVALWSDGFESGDLTSGGWTAQNRNAAVTDEAPYTGSYGASLKKSTGIEKAFSTAGYTGIQVKYRRQTSGFDAGENLYVEWYDGGAWHNLETVQSAGYGDGLQIKTCGTGADKNVNFRLKFRTDADRNTESAFVDDVEIVGIPL
mgnify:CR=1 FL=1